MAQYLVFNIGCIECGVSSAVVGLFDHLPDAEKIHRALNQNASWREGGQNGYGIYELPPTGIIDAQYREYLGEIGLPPEQSFADLDCEVA